MKKMILLSLSLFLLISCLDTNDANDFDNLNDTEFLEYNAQREGVIVTESGLQYEIIEEGNGEKPGPNDFVIVHYHGHLISGEVFDSSLSKGEPSAFSLQDFIEGLSEGVQLMSVGSIYEFVIPAKLAEENSSPDSPIYPGATLIYRVQLIFINTADIDFLEENSEREEVTVTDSGLQYRVIEVGDGEKPTASSTVRVDYEGSFIDGTIFDSSYSRGEPAEFGLQDVISGWTEGLQLMREGSTYEFVIPSDLAYGNDGFRSIYPGATLKFKVELLKILD